ncbi:hypothetical protein PAXRUDRAFT_156362, partial [Paxillus rubicundulus Ve08.2h10]
SPKSKEELPPYLAIPLLHVEYFTVIEWPDDDGEGVGLYKVQRPSTHTAASVLHAVVPLTEVVHALELVPVFTSKIPEIELSSAACLEAYQQYYVNTFADKETYHIFQ